MGRNALAQEASPEVSIAMVGVELTDFGFKESTAREGAAVRDQLKVSLEDVRIYSDQ